MEAEREALDKINEREELSNNLLEAKIQLQNALNNKTTKILKKQADGTWQYEYSANMVDVKEAQKAVQDAEKALEDYDWEQSIEGLRNEAEKLQNSMDNLASQYEDEEFWANREYEQTINSIASAFGDIDKLVEDWMSQYGDISQLTDGYEKLTQSNNTLQEALIRVATALESSYETVGNSGEALTNITSFATGGNISNNGFKNFMTKLPALLDFVDITKFNGLMNRQASTIKTANGDALSTIIQKVECIFPNINTTDGLQKAILELPRLALQTKK